MISGILSGVSGVMGLYSGINGMLNSARKAREQKRLRDEAKADEKSWFARNYYADYLNSSQTQAAIKRVKQTLQQKNIQDRSRAVLSGATPEYQLAQNNQNLNSLDNITTQLVADADQRKEKVMLQHRENMRNIRQNEMNNLQLEEQSDAAESAKGLNLFGEALKSMEWGRENTKHK